MEYALNPILPEFGEVEVYEIPEVKKIVTKALKAHKLKFEFDDETGNFIIPIIAGVAIIAEFGKEEPPALSLSQSPPSSTYTPPHP